MDFKNIDLLLTAVFTFLFSPVSSILIGDKAKTVLYVHIFVVYCVLPQCESLFDQESFRFFIILELVFLYFLFSSDSHP